MPYTYILQFKETGHLYYGVRIANKVNPINDLWVNYFSSSHIIKELIKKNGKESFKYKVHKSFESIYAAYKYENKMLGLIKNKNKHKWFNRTYWSGFGYASLYKTEKHCKAIGDALRNKKRSGEALDKCRESAKLGAEARRGMKDTEEVKRKRAESVKLAMNAPEFKQKHYYSIYMIEGTNYVGEKAVLDVYPITRNTLYNRCKSQKFKDWQSLGKVLQ